MKEVKASLRHWQIEAAQQEIIYLQGGGKNPLLAACPGSGKTLYGIARACRFFNEESGDLVIVIAPTTNIKLRWIDDFRSHGFKTTGDVANSVIRDRLICGENIKSEFDVIVITYSQLDRGIDLFCHYPERYRTLIIADEVHHADDQASYGTSLARVSENAAARLALSGTPFNSSGGALAMCDSEAVVDDDGRPARRTIAFCKYSYGQSLNDKKICRVMEFGVVYGKAKTTYQSLLTGETYSRLTEGKKRTDSLRPFLDPEGEFLPTLIDEALARFNDIKVHHRRAAMLVVAKDTMAADEIASMILDKCNGRYSVQVIVHDSERAHERIARLEKDNTDIVITVRMVSEGIDVKRFRIGVFASDYTTRMFFVQFVGRFIRWDSDLGDEQFARLIFPGHVLLIEYAREIERMIVAANMSIGGSGEGGRDSESVVVGTESIVTDSKIMARGQTVEANDQAWLEQWFELHPDYKGLCADHIMIKIARTAQRDVGGDNGSGQRDDTNDIQKILRKKNTDVMRLIVRLLKQTASQEDAEKLFASVQSRANRHVGIRKMDSLTSEDTLRKRWEFLRRWSEALLRSEPFDE